MTLKVWPKLPDGGGSGNEGYLIARMLFLVIPNFQGLIKRQISKAGTSRANFNLYLAADSWQRE